MLKRVETSWDRVEFSALQISEIEKACGGSIQARQNRLSAHRMLVNITGITAEGMSDILTLITHQTGGRCLSLKFYFTPDEGTRTMLLPIDELEEIGFEYQSNNIWMFNHHPDFSIAAINIPNFVEAEWVLEINKRNGDGVPSSACDYMRLFKQQLSLNLNMDMGVAI